MFTAHIEVGNGYYCSCCRDYDIETDYFDTVDELLNTIVHRRWYVSPNHDKPICSDVSIRKITEGDADGPELSEDIWLKQFTELDEAYKEKLMPLAKETHEKYLNDQNEEAKKKRYERYLELHKEFRDIK